MQTHVLVGGGRDNTKLFVRLLALGCRWADGRAVAAGQLEALLNQTASFRPASQLLDLLICAPVHPCWAPQLVLPFV